MTNTMARSVPSTAAKGLFAPALTVRIVLIGPVWSAIAACVSAGRSSQVIL